MMGLLLVVQPEFGLGREAIALLAALGFIRDGHLDETISDSLLLIVLPEVFFIRRPNAAMISLRLIFPLRMLSILRTSGVTWG